MKCQMYVEGETSHLHALCHDLITLDIRTDPESSDQADLVLKGLSSSELLLQAGALLGHHAGAAHDSFAGIVGHDAHADGEGCHGSRGTLGDCHKQAPCGALLPYPGHDPLLAAVWLWDELEVHNTLKGMSCHFNALTGSMVSFNPLHTRKSGAMVSVRHSSLYEPLCKLSHVLDQFQ